MLYFSKAIALQPRWGGRSGEWENFIRETADRVGGIEGDKFYAQQVWYVLSLHWYTESNLFREFRLDYPRIKRGFEALRSAFPASVSVLSAFCYLASQAGDKPVAWHLFKELAGRVDKDVWWGEQNFATWRNFVLR
jgi:hypothetical protein